ncbi:MAG: hypothetical protein WDN24_21775 [Sphingomonas sp.]
MRRFALFAAAAALVAAPAANAMTVAEFLAKARALQAKGMFAMLSSDLPVLKGRDEGDHARLSRRSGGCACGRP